MAVQHSLFEPAVQRGHYGGVGKIAVQLLDDVAHTTLARRPQDLHHVNFKRAQYRAGSANSARNQNRPSFLATVSLTSIDVRMPIVNEQNSVIGRDFPF